MGSLFKRLQSQNIGRARANCLLLDTSMSMAIQDVEMQDPFAELNDAVGDSTPQKVSRIEALQMAVEGIENRGGLPMYQFNSYPSTVGSLGSMYPHGSTDLGEAFRYLKKLARDSAILVTDGQPDSKADALEASRGLHLDIIYIGNGEMPEFLSDLAKACGGTAGALSLSKPLEIAQKIAGLLEPGKVVS